MSVGMYRNVFFLNSRKQSFLKTYEKRYRSVHGVQGLIRKFSESVVEQVYMLDAILILSQYAYCKMQYAYGIFFTQYRYFF
jgi:hypothetical protein